MRNQIIRTRGPARSYLALRWAAEHITDDSGLTLVIACILFTGGKRMLPGRRPPRRPIRPSLGPRPS